MRIDDIISIATQAESLKGLHRTGWSIAGLNRCRQESVAEHSFGTALLTLLLSEYLQQEGEAIDQQKALAMAIIHDLAESRISDIPQSAVAAGGKPMADAKKTAELNAIYAILSDNHNLLSIYNELEEQKSAESRIVRGADLIDMLLHALTLESSGASPKIFQPFFQNSKSAVENVNIPAVTKLYEQLVNSHEENLERF
jgi:putative hydrolase of HD superfamily